MARKIFKTKKLALTELRGRPSTLAKLFRDRSKERSQLFNRAASRISKYPERSAIIPYTIRALLDIAEGKATKLQKSIVAPIYTSGLQDIVLRRYFELPSKTALAFGNKFFKASTPSAADKLLKEEFAKAEKQISGQIKQNKSFTLQMGLRDLIFLPGAAWNLVDHANTFGQPPIKCPPLYQLRLTYRGITTHNTGDRSGGVEPYMVTGFYRIPFGTNSIQEMSGPMKVEQHPKNLGDMGTGYWMPSGGNQDGQGNPSNPIQFYPIFLDEETIEITGPFGGLPYEYTFTVKGRLHPIQESPILLGPDTHFAVISVWEEDGDQAAKLLRTMGKFVSGIGSYVGGGVVVAIGAALQLASYVTGANDDPIGDFILVFNQNTLNGISSTSSPGFAEYSARVKNGGNDWTIWIGADSRRLPNN